MNKCYLKCTYAIKSREAYLFMVNKKIKLHEIYYLFIFNNKICLIEILEDEGIFNVYYFLKPLCRLALEYCIDMGFDIKDLVYKNKYVEFVELD